MIVTEKQAAKKWCHFTRVIPDDLEARVSWNRVSHDDGTVIPEASMCIGSRCMSWRWHVEHVLVNLTTGKAVPAEDGEFFDARQWCRQYRPSTTHGYCGLAGKP